LGDGPVVGFGRSLQIQDGAAADASNLEPLMGPGVGLWIFGHSHLRFDERINGTRLVSNPRGYPDQPVPGFDARCTLEI